jgi:hypothetical protein
MSSGKKMNSYRGKTTEKENRLHIDGRKEKENYTNHICRKPRNLECTVNICRP